MTAPAVIPVTGDVDITTIDALRAEVEAVVARAPAEVIFDLSAASFIDSSSLALFAQTSARVGRVVIRDPSPIVRRVIEATGLDDIVVLEP